MASRTALVLETNPVITERYLDYTHESDWRIMLKDTLNGFLEKLQQEKFNLIVAEESLVPQGIIQMMKATGIPLLLSSNTKNAEIQTLPRNFNRTELLTVFDRLVPPLPEDFNEKEDEKTEPFGENDKVHTILSDLEDEDDDFFELSSNDVVLEPSAAGKPENGIPEPQQSFFDDNGSKTDDLVSSLSVDFKPKETGESAEFELNGGNVEEKREQEAESDGSGSDDFLFGDSSQGEVQAELEKTQAESASSEIKEAVSEWMDKNARSIIKEIVLEQLASLSGNHND